MLQHLGDNLLAALNAKRLEKSEIKFVAKGMLTALRELHENNYVHTGIYTPNLAPCMSDPDMAQDIKPDNILVDYSSGPSRFERAALGDYGDTCLVEPKDHLKVGEEGHIIGVHMFRSPEAMLNLGDSD